ncbi:MAG: hypothetical protein AB1779_03145 [Candidatus Thermoplasmatota archaeon]
MLGRVEKHLVATETRFGAFIYLVWGFVMFIGYGAMYIIWGSSWLAGFSEIVKGMITFVFWFGIAGVIMCIAIRIYKPRIQAISITAGKEEWLKQRKRGGTYHGIIWTIFAIWVFVIGALLGETYGHSDKLWAFIVYGGLTYTGFGMYVAESAVSKRWKEHLGMLLAPILMLLLSPLVFFAPADEELLWLSFAYCIGSAYFATGLLALYQAESLIPLPESEYDGRD